MNSKPHIATSLVVQRNTITEHQLFLFAAKFMRNFPIAGETFSVSQFPREDEHIGVKFQLTLQNDECIHKRMEDLQKLIQEYFSEGIEIWAFGEATPIQDPFNV